MNALALLLILTANSGVGNIVAPGIYTDGTPRNLNTDVNGNMSLAMVAGSTYPSRAVSAVFAKSGTNIIVTVNPLSAEVCNAFATIEAL